MEKEALEDRTDLNSDSSLSAPDEAAPSQNADATRDGIDPSQLTRGLLDLSQDLLLALGLDGQILHANLRASEALGLEAGKLASLTLDNLLHTDSKEAGKELLHHIRAGEERLDVTVRLVPEIGRPFLVHGEALPHRTDGQLDAVLLLVRDQSNSPMFDGAPWHSESLYRLFVETLDEGIAVQDEEARFTFVNDRLCEMLGYEREELLGRPVTDLLDEENQRVFLKHADKRQKGQHEPYELRFEGKGGAQVDARVSPRPVFEQDGVFRGYFEIISDQRWREQARRPRPDGELRFRSLMDHAADAFFIHDLEGRVREANQCACTSLGYSRDELLGLSVEDIEVDADIESLRVVWRDLKPGSPITLQGEHRREDGTTFPVEVRLGRFEFGGNPLFLAIARDVAERKRADERLLRYQRQLRSVASKLSLAEERERRRIAADLHDHIAQNLVLSRIKLGTFQESLADDVDKDPLSEVRALLEHVIQDTRTLIFEISPPILYELGLVPAIEWLSELVSEQGGLECRVDDDGEPKPLSEDIRVVLFQAVRELLINVIKHAHATLVTVEFRVNGGMIRVSVDDNGVGMGAKKLPMPVSRNSGFGLFNIRDRLDLLGGGLEVESPQGKGTKVTLLAPLKTEEGDS